MSDSVAPPAELDICVIGGGIVGLATARELAGRHPDAKIAVLEREDQLATHQSGHSSGVIHAGIYYQPGSLKARLCVEGARRLYEYCAERGIDARRDGKVIVATDPDELERLGELERRGKANEVPGLERIGPEELRQLEPHAVGLAALHSPNTGVVDFPTVTRSYAEDFTAGGGSIHTGCEVSGLDPGTGKASIAHAAGTTRATKVVVCAGPWADRLAVEAGASPDPKIVPFRGAYLRLKPASDHLVRANIYPVPDPELPFLGMHLTRAPSGEVLLGPTALFVGARDAYRLSRIAPRDLSESLTWPGTWKVFARFWRTGLAELQHALSLNSFVRECRRYVPELTASDVDRTPYAGVRAQAVARDGSLIDEFVVSRIGTTVHVRNAPSPAATSSLALAEEIADRLDAVD